MAVVIVQCLPDRLQRTDGRGARRDPTHRLDPDRGPAHPRGVEGMGFGQLQRPQDAAFRVRHVTMPTTPKSRATHPADRQNVCDDR